MKQRNKNDLIIVENAHKFQSHFSCDNESNSEIVAQICKISKLNDILDLDSNILERFC